VAQVSQKQLQYLIQTLVSFKTRNSLSDPNSSVVGVGAARSWIKAEFDQYAQTSGGRMTVEYDTFIAQGSGLPRAVEMRNVVATLKGDQSGSSLGRIVMVSGHYDSRASNGNDGTTDAPGANDDGSGTALVMELARIMAPMTFRATVIFVAFCGEEQGLFGSKNLAAKAVSQGWNIVAQLNNDIVGSSGDSSETHLRDNIHIRIFNRASTVAEQPNDSPMRQLARYIREVGMRYVDQLDPVLVFRTDRYLRGGDQTPFLDAGFTSVRITEMNENFQRQHQDVRVVDGVQYGDLEQYIDYPFLAKVSAMDLATLANLALAPSSPTNVALSRTLNNFSQISWTAPTLGNPVVGYYVLYRATHEGDWSNKLFVATTTVTLPYSKDNYIFGVQAVDQAGHESLVVLAA